MSERLTIQKHHVCLRAKNVDAIEQMIHEQAGRIEHTESFRAFAARCNRVAEYLVVRYRRAHPRCAIGWTDAYFRTDDPKAVCVRFIAFEDIADAADRAAIQAGLDNRNLDGRPYRWETVTNEAAYLT